MRKFDSPKTSDEYVDFYSTRILLSFKFVSVVAINRKSNSGRMKFDNSVFCVSVF